MFFSHNGFCLPFILNYNEAMIRHKDSSSKRDIILLNSAMMPSRSEFELLTRKI